jgi:hypothetical protein
MQSFASAIAATIMLIALLGLPDFVPFAMSFPQISAALSSKGRILLANRAWGPSWPENQRSNCWRFLPSGLFIIHKPLKMHMLGGKSFCTDKPTHRGDICAPCSRSEAAQY